MLTITYDIPGPYAWTMKATAGRIFLVCGPGKMQERGGSLPQYSLGCNCGEYRGPWRVDPTEARADVESHSRHNPVHQEPTLWFWEPPVLEVRRLWATRLLEG